MGIFIDGGLKVLGFWGLSAYILLVVRSTEGV